MAGENRSVEQRVPIDETVERVVLGAMMLAPELTTQALESLQVNDFYNSSHKMIFKIIKKLFTKGLATDIVMVSRALQHLGRLAEGNTHSNGRVSWYYLTGLTESVPSLIISRLGDHIMILRRYARLRGIQQVLSHYSKEVKVPMADADSLIDSMIAELSNIEVSADARRSIKLGKSVEATKKQIQNLRIGKQDGSIVPPFPELRKLGYWHAGDLIVLGGDTGSGKTTLALETVRLLAHTGVHCGMICLEQTADQLTKKLISAEADRKSVV